MIIEHFGTKGMHWGVRKKSLPDSVKGPRTSYQKAPARLSDVELKRRISRMELEKKYSDLNNPPKSSGAAYAHNILQSSGKTVASTIVSTTAAFMIGRALKNKFG